MDGLESHATKPQLAGSFERALDPAVTLARLQKHFAPLGITRIANVTGLDCIGIPVVNVVRPNARSLSVSQGKGLTIEAAAVSGVMEAIELYHAERVLSPLRFATLQELRCQTPVADVERCPRVGITPMSTQEPILWIEGVDLANGGPLWLPFELVHLRLTAPFPAGTGRFALSSNGLASGNTPLEAVLHGLCEVIERDAATLFRARNSEAQAARQVALDSIYDPSCRQLLERYAGAGVAVGVWDITSDVGVPAIRCEIVDAEENPFRTLPPVEGFGCHSSPPVALSRALTEAAQARLTLIAGSRDDNFPSVYNPEHNRQLASLSRARIAGRPTLRFDAVRPIELTRGDDILTAITRRLLAVDLRQVIVVNLSNPAFDIPVVRVVVPGLEPYHGVDGARSGERLLALAREEGAS